MPSCVLANSEGFLAVVSTDVSACTGYVIVTASDYEYMMGFTEVTSIEATAAFSGAFSLVFVSGFAMTYIVKLAIRLIKLA